MVYGYDRMIFGEGKLSSRDRALMVQLTLVKENSLVTAPGECSRSLKDNMQEHKLCRKDVADFGCCGSAIDRSSSGALLIV